jgi:hypothetical protein
VKPLDDRLPGAAGGDQTPRAEVHPIISTYVINGEESIVDVPETTAPA